MSHKYLLTLILVLVSCSESRRSLTLDTSSKAWQNDDVDRMLSDPNLDESAKSYFQDLKLVCSSQSVSRVEGVPIYHDRSDSPTFTFYYEANIPRPSEPTIIYLQGGPGLPSIGNRSHWTTGNFVNTDQRGVGCNYATRQSHTDDVITTRQAVRDIGYVIKHLGLKDFIIFGHSYGTVSATQLAFHLENDLNMRPRAVVLMGTAGHTFGGMRAWHMSHIDQWQRLKSEYPKAGLLFANGRLPNLGGTRAEWGRYLFNVGNHYRASGEQLEALYDELSASASGGGAGPVMQLIREKFHGEDPSYNHQLPSYLSFVFTKISCEEIFNPLDFYGQSIDRYGNMDLIVSPNTPPNNDMCDGIAERFAYDSKIFQLQSPLIYLHGETDPQTPLSQGYYHFLNQNLSSRKEWILVGRGSHNPLDDALKPCREQIWNAIKRGDSVSSLLTSNGYCLKDDFPEI